MTNRFLCGTLLLVALTGALVHPSEAADFVRLKSGEVRRCVVLRQDTVAVYTTDEAHRATPQPPLQVYGRSEVESIWLDQPPSAVAHVAYRPHTSGLEAGGSFGVQTWAETTQLRRYLIWTSLHGGFDVTPALGLEMDADATIPFGKKADVVWHRNVAAYQAIMNVAAHPFIWRGLVPFAVAGGGIALDVPNGDLMLTRSNDVHNVVDFGLGAKWGSNGFGYRLEWRHHYYIWTPDQKVLGKRVAEQSADASIIRATLFFYR
jgi:hypothetical protein